LCCKIHTTTLQNDLSVRNLGNDVALELPSEAGGTFILFVNGKKATRISRLSYENKSLLWETGIESIYHWLRHFVLFRWVLDANFAYQNKLKLNSL